MPKFINTVQKQSEIFGGSLSGTYYFNRFGGDRLIWIQVMEYGYSYVRLQIKGLELQETSCHALEATKIDDILEETFYDQDSRSGSGCGIMNPNFCTTLEPINTIIVDSYSNAKNVLTGVIESPELSLTIKQLFAKVFIWVCLKFKLNQPEQNNPSNSNIVDVEQSGAMKMFEQTLFRKQTPVERELSRESIITQNLKIRPDSLKSPTQFEWSDEDDILGPETRPYLTPSSRAS